MPSLLFWLWRCLLRDGVDGRPYEGEFKGTTPSVVLQIRVRRTIEFILSLALEDDEDDAHVLCRLSPRFTMLRRLPRTRSKMQSFHLVCNSTATGPPLSSSVLLSARRCAMNVKLRPSGSPYLIIPRIMLDEDVAHSVRVSAETRWLAIEPQALVERHIT